MQVVCRLHDLVMQVTITSLKKKMQKTFKNMKQVNYCWACIRTWAFYRGLIIKARKVSQYVR